MITLIRISFLTQHEKRAANMRDIFCNSYDPGPSKLPRVPQHVQGLLALQMLAQLDPRDFDMFRPRDDDIPRLHPSSEYDDEAEPERKSREDCHQHAEKPSYKIIQYQKGVVPSFLLQMDSGNMVSCSRCRFLQES